MKRVLIGWCTEDVPSVRDYILIPLRETMSDIVFPIFLNQQQKEAVDFALSGHNFILLGCAGTGKSVTLSTIVRKLRVQGKVVALTCSTGIMRSKFMSHPAHLTSRMRTGSSP